MDSVTENHTSALWAWRSLAKMDESLRKDLLSDPQEQYLVPASAGVVGLAMSKLGIDPTAGDEGNETWRHLRGRPTARLFACYEALKAPVQNEDSEEIDRLIGAFGRKYEDALPAPACDRASAEGESA